MRPNRYMVATALMLDHVRLVDTPPAGHVENAISVQAHPQEPELAPRMSLLWDRLPHESRQVWRRRVQQQRRGR